MHVKKKKDMNLIILLCCNIMRDIREFFKTKEILMTISEKTFIVSK